jgi:hypothetical protein
MVFGIPAVFVYGGGPQRLGEYYPQSEFKSLSNTGGWEVNIIVLTPQLGALQMGLQKFNGGFL